MIDRVKDERMIMKRYDDAKCGVCSTPQFERNCYFYGKQFTVRDLTQEQSYFNDKRYLINRMVLGWGVVCGLEVKEDGECLVVTPGLALGVSVLIAVLFCSSG